MRIVLLCFITVITGCHTHNAQLKIVDTDSTSVQNNSDTISDYSEPVINAANVPAWLLEYVKTPIDTNQFFHERYSFIDEFHQLNDSVDVVIYGTSDGVCLRRYVATFVRGKAIDKCCIATGCDSDLSSPVYKYTEHSTTNNLMFHVLEITDSPLYDSVLTSSGDFKEGIDLDNTAIASDTIAYDIKVLPTGAIAGKHD